MVGFFNFTDGANYGLSPFLVPPTQLMGLENCNISTSLGVIRKEPGYFIVNNVLRAGKFVYGLHSYLSGSGIIERDYAVVENAAGNAMELYSRSGGNWTEIAAAEVAWNIGNARVKFENFIDKVFAVGADGAGNFLTSAVITGTTFSTSGDATGMPKAKYIKRYRDRLYVANCEVGSTEHPYRVYFSTIPSAGAITWDPVDFIDVDFGERITGLAVNYDRLFIFTDRKTYVYDQETLKLAWAIGAPSDAAISVAGVNIVWANSYGVWVSVQGGQPQNIGGPVFPFIKNAFFSQTWFSAIVDEEYWLYIGEVQIEEKQYNNIALVFNFPTSSWRTRTFASPMSAFLSKFDNITQQELLYMGSDNQGLVWQYSKPDIDIYSPNTPTPIYADDYISSSNKKKIPSSFVLPPFKLESYNVQMYIDKLVAYAENAGNLEIQVRSLDNNSEALTPWVSIGSLKTYQKEFSLRSLQATLLQVKGDEISDNPSWKAFGFDVELIKASDLKD